MCGIFVCYNKPMQKIAVKVFVYASIAFVIIGLSLILLGGPSDNVQPNVTLMKMLLTTVFIILPSFALSVAGKYLDDRS